MLTVGKDVTPVRQHSATMDLEINPLADHAMVRALAQDARAEARIRTVVTMRRVAASSAAGSTRSGLSAGVW